MTEFFQQIRDHFNIIHKDDYLSLTLINPNISLDIMEEIRAAFKSMGHLRKQQIVILETANFDDDLLVVLAASLPHSLTQLSLDFTGCQSLKGPGFVDLFESISKMESLTKLHLDLCEVPDINDLVIEGLSLLFEMLPGLTDFYLDLYEVDQITEDGYLMLAQSIGCLAQLQKLHIDLSANPALTEDALQLLFSALPQSLASFCFRILDIEHIGGGSFFRLADSISQMKRLEKISLTISTFENLNQKGIYSLVKSVGATSTLRDIEINFSNINLPEKMLSYFSFPENLQHLSLDVSCNRALSDRDLICLTSKLATTKKLKSICLNFDFCAKITEDAIEQLIERVLEIKPMMKIRLPERKYSPEFMDSCSGLMLDKYKQKMVLFSCGAGDCIKDKGMSKFEIYKRDERARRNILFAGFLMRNNKHLASHSKDISRLFLC